MEDISLADIYKLITTMQECTLKAQNTMIETRNYYTKCYTKNPRNNDSYARNNDKYERNNDNYARNNNKYERNNDDHARNNDDYAS